jgi:hypothetical protein
MVLAKRDQLNTTVASLHSRFGIHSITSGKAISSTDVVIPTGFPGLDQILYIGGIPVNAITVLAGRITSGKRTLAYKILGNAQYSTPDRLQSIAILDQAHTTDFDHAARCGIHLDHLFVSRPGLSRTSIDVLMNMIRSRELRAILLDHIGLIRENKKDWQYMCATLPQLNIFLKASNCAVLFLDDMNGGQTYESIAPQIALYLELERKGWIEDEGEFRGYESQVRVIRTKRGRVGASVSIRFDYHTIMRGHETW